MLNSIKPFGRALLAALLPLASACTLTSTNVEPDLPSGQVNASNTVVYRADGLPVVAHNYADLGTVVAIFLFDPRGVAGQLELDSTLTIRAYDKQNASVPEIQNHSIELTLLDFQGVGTYRLRTPGMTHSLSSYQLSTRQQNPNAPSATQTFYPVPTAVPEVTITLWDPATKHLKGTFSFTAASTTGAQTVEITDGRFDLVLD